MTPVAQDRTPPITRSEWGWLSVAVIAGATLRLGHLQFVAVEHFDEAVYASNLLFPAEQGGEYPYRQLYAPPLLPAAIEWTTILGQMIFGTVPTWWPMLPALLCGLASIPSIWWIARRWFSPRAGMIASLLLAFNEFHAAYCRTALTDIPLSLFVLWAVHRFWIALGTGRPRDAVIAGAVTSLAWWTKYNGWLPLAITLSGGTLWQLLTPRAERDWSKLVRVWLLGTATACVIWLPVLWDCQKIGGYAAVAANHRQYVDGFSRWVENFRYGSGCMTDFSGLVTTHGTGIALLAILFGTRKLSGSAEDQKSGSIPGSVQCLGMSLCIGWFWGLFIATPMYFPYPRLWLTWIIALLLIVVAGIFHGLSWPMRWHADAVRAAARLTALIGVSLLVTQGFRFHGRLLTAPASWESRFSAHSSSQAIRVRIADPGAAVFVHSEPAIWFHLRQQGQPAVIAPNLEFLKQPMPGTVYFVAGPQAGRDPQFQRELAEYASRLEQVAKYDFEPSRIVLLDESSPDDLREHPQLRTHTVTLYRVR